jgi:hypothetical protein
MTCDIVTQLTLFLLKRLQLIVNYVLTHYKKNGLNIIGGIFCRSLCHVSNNSMGNLFLSNFD